MLYFDEVNGVCPLCGVFLMHTKKSKSKVFEIAHIYPNSPNLLEQAILTDVEKLGGDSEDFRNKIALCKTCHRNYDSNKTVDDYMKLLNIKKTLLSRQLSKADMSLTNIEDDIYYVMNMLSSPENIKLIELEQLSLSALRISEKVENEYHLLKRNIEFNTSNYYCFIQNEFKNLNQSKKNRFELIASAVHNAYLHCSSNTEDKELIFVQLTEWLKSKTNGNDEACRIIISFFVQNCEVYDKIAK